MSPEDYGRYLATPPEQPRTVRGADLADQTDRVLARGRTSFDPGHYDIRLEGGKLVRRQYVYIDNPLPEDIDGKPANSILRGKLYPEDTDYDFLMLLRDQGVTASLFLWGQMPS